MKEYYFMNDLKGIKRDKFNESKKGLPYVIKHSKKQKKKGKKK